MKYATLKNGLKIALIAGGFFALVPTVYGQAIGLQGLERMTAGTPQQVERGAQVFDDQCAECHGDEGIAPTELGEQMGADGFVDTDVERSGLKSIFQVVTHGYDYEEGQHPVFENLRYQDRWAVAHYTHGLIDEPQPDPPEVVERVRREAQEGICDPEIRDEVIDFAEPRDEEQLELGADIYQQECFACHGDDGRADVPGAQTDPPARDFHDDPDQWTNGTSPFAIFETLDQGIEGTAMPGFGYLDEEELWAMVHYVREEFIPAENLAEVTEEEIDAVCRTLSAPPAPEPIPVNRAAEFLAQDADTERMLQLLGYGDPLVHVDADTERGQQLFQQSCASCHGDEAIGPYGKFPPYMQIEAGDLVPASVGGTYEDVAQRVIQNAHASLPDRPTVATYSQQDWKDIQGWIATFPGEGQDRIRTIESLEEARQYLDDTPADEETDDELEELEDLDEEELEELDDEELEQLQEQLGEEAATEEVEDDEPETESEEEEDAGAEE